MMRPVTDLFARTGLLIVPVGVAAYHAAAAVYINQGRIVAQRTAMQTTAIAASLGGLDEDAEVQLRTACGEDAASVHADIARREAERLAAQEELNHAGP